MRQQRVGGRVLLRDASSRLLLIHERLEDGSTHWLTPGGGVEPGESPAAAARRELVEETGIDVELDSDTAVLVTRRDWSWAGIDYDQTDHFFSARVPDATPVRPRGLTAVETQTLIGTRWWTGTELAATTAVLLPPDLAAILAGLDARAGGGG